MALVFVKADVTRPNGKRACARIDCPNTFEPHGAQRYCSRHCSVLTRNRRYYETYKGRMNKRASASRYFQNHREELYGKRRDRMEGYVQEILNERISKECLSRECSRECRANGCQSNDMFTDGRLASPRRDLSRTEYIMLDAKRIARIKHDWHPEPWDSRIPPEEDLRRWESRHQDEMSLKWLDELNKHAQKLDEGGRSR